jgi:tetratricopeptide (TPR) repeat protein
VSSHDIARQVSESKDALRAAICYLNLALQVYNPIQYPHQWGEVHYHLGGAYYNIYNQSQADDRQQYLNHAITAYKTALSTYSRQTEPLAWANAHYDLGNAYKSLQLGAQRKNLHKAVACYRAALLVYSKDGLDHEWALTQYELGNAYQEIALQESDRAVYLQSALECYQESAKTFTRLKLEKDLHKVCAAITEVRTLLETLQI